MKQEWQHANLHIFSHWTSTSIDNMTSSVMNVQGPTSFIHLDNNKMLKQHDVINYCHALQNRYPLKITNKDFLKTT